MKNQTLPGLVSILFFGFATAAWADVTIPGEGCPAQLTDDVQIDGCGKLTLSAAIDLKGHRLVLTGVSGMEGNYSITDTKGGGVLDIEVTDATTQTGSFDGKLKFIKRGNGELTVAENGFSGGMEIRAGTVIPKSYGKKYKYYGDPPAVVVDVGAVMKLNACYGFTDQHSITLDGGTLSSANRADSKFSNPIGPKIILKKNSCLDIYKDVRLSSSIELKGSQLEVSGAAQCGWEPRLVDAGTICVNNGKLTLLKNVGLETAGYAPTADLLLKGEAEVKGAFTYSVNNLTVEGSATIESTIAVYGSYRPSLPATYAPKMMAESTLDLSALEEPMVLSAANFDAGTVTIDLGDRSLKADQQIVSWTIPPENVSFMFTGENIGEGKTFSVLPQGIVYDAASDAVVTATWIGGHDGWMNPENWECRNADGDVMTGKTPTATTVVTFKNDVSALGLDETFPFAGLRFKDAYLSRQPEWTGFDFGCVTADSVLDVRGTPFVLSAWGTTSKTGMTITNSSESVALLRFAVAEGCVFTNDSLTVAGNLKLIKTGAGTFVQAKVPQTYAGGTVVEEGVFATAVTDFSANDVLGSDKSVTVATRGVLDPCGSYNWSNYTIVLDGGMISNTVKQTGMSNDAYNAATNTFAYPFNPQLRLNGDAVLASVASFNYKGKLVPNGHVLFVETGRDSDFRWYPTEAENAHVTFRSGKVKVLKNIKMDYPDLTLEMAGATFDFGGVLSVSNYIASTTELDPVRTKDDWHTNAVLRLDVGGTFSPRSTKFFGCTMLNGSTIDLAACEGFWSSEAVRKSGNQNGNPHVLFADGATVTIDVGDREFKGVERVVAWSEGSKTSVAGATFVLNAAAKAKGYCLTRDADGLSVGRKGFLVFVQ